MDGAPAGGQRNGPNIDATERESATERGGAERRSRYGADGAGVSAGGESDVADSTRSSFRTDDTPGSSLAI